jgi:hypothetical protein
MRLESISNLFNDIRLECPGAPDPLILARARMAITEFCKRSLISNETLSLHDIEAAEPLVQLCPPNSCVNIWRVMWVKSTVRFLPVEDRQQLSDYGSDWEKHEDEYPSSYMMHRQNDIIRLYPTPTIDIADELTIHCAFVPHPDTTKMDKVLYDFYREGIVQGAVAKLQRMPGTNWYNPDSAAWNERQFNIELLRAKANQNKDNSLADLTVMQRPFA